MKYSVWVFILILVVVCSQDTCTTNFDCLQSACCKNSKCSSIDECLNDMNVIYVLVGCAGITFIIGTIIYFCLTVKRSIKNVNEMKAKLKSKQNEKN